METKEHAQLIYASLLSGWVSAGKLLTNPEQMGLIDVALLHAEAFAKAANKVKTDI